MRASARSGRGAAGSAAGSAVRSSAQDLSLLCFYPAYNYHNNLLHNNCSHSLLLFAFSIACRQDFKALRKASQTKFTASSLISLLRKLHILARGVCLLFVRFLSLGPITVPFSAPHEPPFYPDPRTRPSLLHNLTKRTPVPGRQPPEDLAVPLRDVALQWFSDVSKCD